MRKILIIGHVGQDAVLRYTPSGKPIGNFSVAVNERWTDAAGAKREKTEWFRVVWDKFAETITPFLKQGREVYVEGIPSADAWIDKTDGSARGQVRIRALNVRRLGAKKEDEPLPAGEEVAVADELPA